MIIFVAIISTLVTWAVIKLGHRFKLLDDPRTHSHPKVVHDRPVPRGGGLPIFVAVSSALLFYLGPSQKVIGIVLGMLVLTLIGLIDDIFEEKVSPYFRLGINALAALMVIGSGIGIAYITNPFGGTIDLSWPRFCLGTHCLWLLSDIFALGWLVVIQNIVGWSSGVDGQLPGFVVIAALTMAALGLKFGPDQNQVLVITLALATAGAYLGFLPWNWFPQKIMPGYGGKSLAGFLLGVLAILSSAKVGALILVLGIPFLDATRVILKRLWEKRSPVWGGREHLHHYLLDRGWGKRRIAAFYWLASGIFAVLAFNLNSSAKYFTMATVALLFFGTFAWWHYWSIFSKPRVRDNGLKT